MAFELTPASLALMTKAIARVIVFVFEVRKRPSYSSDSCILINTLHES